MFKQRIYMDYAGGAPELASVSRMVRQAEKLFSNPSSIHKDGIRALRALTESRTIISKFLGVQSEEIIFVGSGTESDNLAIIGSIKNAQKSLNCDLKSLHIITTEIEHSAVLESCRALEKEGVSVTYLSVDKDGIINMQELREALRSETILVTISYVNNEIGAVQPIKEIAKEIRHFRKKINSQKNLYPLFHTDACQAGQYFDLSIPQLGVDMLSLNGTKIGGPMGTGILYIRKGVEISPIVYGGGQERGIRSGTQNVSGAVGFACAVLEAEKNREKESLRLIDLRDFFIKELQKNFPEIRINGSLSKRSPNNVNVSFKNINSELLILELDALGISASAGSACSSSGDDISHVLKALYKKSDLEDWGNVRFSLGKTTKKKDIKYVCSALKKIFEKYKPWQKN